MRRQYAYDKSRPYAGRFIGRPAFIRIQRLRSLPRIDGKGERHRAWTFTHGANQIIRQARAPLGAMPVYPPLKISDAQLVEIISYIQSLEDAEGHAAI